MLQFRSPPLRFIFVAAAVVVIGTIAVIYWMGKVALNANRQLASQRAVIALLDRVGAGFKDAETGQRGYLLTGEDSYLEPYTKALRTWNLELDSLERAVSRGQLAGQDVTRLKRLAEDKFGEMEQTLQLKRRGDLDGALAMVRSNRGKELMDALNSQLGAMAVTEIEEFETANRRTNTATHERNATFIVSALLNLAFLAWAYRKIAREIHAREAAQADLLNSHAQLEARVQERTAELATANRQLASTNTQLTAANKELEAFGYSVSHDLRAPLRHVSSYIKLLEKNIGSSLDESNRRMVRTISEAAQRMGSLIDDLLVLSRIGRASLSETNVDLKQVLEEARKELAPETAGRSIEWHIGRLPEVRGDATLLRSAVVNLVSNAIKYTRRRNPARIEVGSREENGHVVCFVRDNGAGFDMRYADKLFGVFQRLHDRGDFEGTGIGLASVRRIIQRHGGRTWAEGEVDRGATFYFTLPKERLE